MIAYIKQAVVRHSPARQLRLPLGEDPPTDLLLLPPRRQALFMTPTSYEDYEAAREATVPGSNTPETSRTRLIVTI
jgi:hypothetical protein